MNNLWEKIDIAQSLISPFGILKSQAEYFDEVYKDYLNASIRTHRTTSKDTPFVFSLDISTKTTRYKYNVLSISYPLGFYPVEIRTYGDVIREVMKNGSENEAIIAMDEQEYIKYLSDIFNSSKIKKAIESLIIQSREENSGDEELPF